jgi:Trypsin
MKFRAAAVVISLGLSTLTYPAVAGYNAEIDLSNPRIVPIYTSNTDATPNAGNQASYSGFLYSSRIVFSAAHSEYQFDNQGNKINFGSKFAYVGVPNSTAGDYKGLVKIQKRYVAKNYRFDDGTLDDFAVYVLEKDLISAPPVKLLTPELETEIRESRTPIKMHGYGEYKDRCDVDEKMPCTPKYQKTFQPRSLSTLLLTLAQAEAIVGYRRPSLANHLTMNNGRAGFGCSGDSGGSVTTTYKNEFIYLSTTPNGMNAYSCGASGDHDGKGGINYASPVYKHLDIIKEAEDYVAAALAQEALAKAKSIPTPSPTAKPKKKTITCIQGKTTAKITGANPKCPPGYKKK